MNALLLAAEETGKTDWLSPESLETARNYVTEKGADLAIAVVSAAAVFIIGRWVARLLVRLVERISERAGMDVTLQKFLCNMLYGFLLTFIVIAALGRLGVETQSISAVVAAAGLAVGFALQGSLSNFAAGVMMIIFKPFKVGNLVEAAGVMGTVEEIGIFSTVLNSLDNKRIIVPNGSITGDNIVNFSSNGVLRLDLVFGCGYEDDLREVKAFLQETVMSDPRVLREPVPTVAVNELGDSSVNFVVRPYVRVSDYWPLKWDLIEAVKIGFDDRGFSIPYPQTDMHIQSSGNSEPPQVLRAA